MPVVNALFGQYCRRLTVKEIEGGTESDIFDGVVRLEGDPDGSASRFYGSRMTASAEASEQRGKSVRTVAQFHVVVGASFRLLDVELAAEYDSYSMTRWRCRRNETLSRNLKWNTCRLLRAFSIKR